MNRELLTAHRERAGYLLEGVSFKQDDEAVRDVRRAAKKLDDDLALSLYVLLVEDAALHREHYGWSGGRIVTDLARRPLPWTAPDVELLFDVALTAHHYNVTTAAKAAVGVAESVDPALRHGIVPRLPELITRLRDEHYDPGGRARLAARMRALIEAADPPTRAAVRTGVIDMTDGWGAAAVERLEAVTTNVDAVSALLAHAAAVPAGPRPKPAWLRRTDELVAAHPGLMPLVRELVELGHTCRPIDTTYYGMTLPMRISPGNDDVFRGLLWTAARSDDSWSVPTVLALIADGFMGKVRNTCYAVLGHRADTASVAALIRLQRETRDGRELTHIAAALDEAATSIGITRSELTEQTIPDGGLDQDRSLRITGGTTTGVVTLDGLATVALAWERDGVRTAKPPADTDPDLVREVKRAAAELKKVVAGERDRLEDLLVEDREWPLATWRQRYLDHPVTGSLAHRLLWTLVDGDRAEAVLPASDGTFIGADGGTIAPGDGARIRVWHPVRANADTVRAWRAHILARELKQPFKQAFREVYLLTPAEEQTRVYSNRFAGHVLRYQQTYALMKQRRWSTNYLGGWDGGYAGEAKRDFPAHGLRAAFFHDRAGDDDAAATGFCTTDQVRFHRIGDRGQEPVPLTDVPPAVFSEAMRDVDLFIGVTSIATDPAWADRGTDRFHGYWQKAAFGELGANAQIRRQVLEHLLPRLRIRDRARLDGNFLVVDGSRHTYRIHLGSGNILMSPNDRYLCIVPARSARPAGARFVPFDGDEMLSVVLSKALMLADDHRITDQSILRQID
jgi:hypothetical protein